MFPDHKTAEISAHTYATTLEGTTPFTGALPPDTVIFIVGTTRVYLMLRKGHELIVGRHHLTNTQQPELDLSTFGAAEAGTSRLHAALSHQKNGWWFKMKLQLPKAAPKSLRGCFPTYLPYEMLLTLLALGSKRPA